MNGLRPGNTQSAALGLLAACGACLALTTGTIVAGKTERKQVTLTEKANDTRQKLTQGDLLVVRLETQPGTGFGWSIAKCDRDHLTPLSSVVLENPNKVAGGKTVRNLLTFRADGAGSSDLELHYKRPFDRDKPPARTFQVTVNCEPVGKQVTLTDKDNNTKQKLSRGDTLVVHLETEPGTGFSWAVAGKAGERLPLLSGVLLENSDKLPGGKAVQVFTFRAASVGASDLELHYRRPFEKGKEPARTFKVMVTIDE